MSDLLQEEQKYYVEEKDFKGKNKIWRCDVTKGGEVVKITPEKEYMKHKKTGVVRAVYFIIAKPQYFHVVAPNHDEAVDKMNKVLQHHSEKLMEQSKKKSGPVDILEK